MMSNQELTGLPINSDQENINRLLNNFTREESEKNEIIDILEYKIQNNEFNEGLTDLKLSLNNRNIEDAKYSIDEFLNSDNENLICYYSHFGSSYWLYRNNDDHVYTFSLFKNNGRKTIKKLKLCNDEVTNWLR